VAGCIAGTGLILTMTRGAILAAELGLVILSFQRGRKSGLVGLALAVLFLVVVFPRFVDWRLSITYGANLQQAHLVLDESSFWRLDTLVAGLKLFRLHPIFGVGLGQFHYASPQFLSSNVGITYAHDWFVNVLAEQGLLGFSAFALMVLSTFWTLLRSSASRSMIAVYAVFLLSCLTTEPVSSLQTSGLFWILLGLALAVAHVAGDYRAPKSVDPASDLSGPQRRQAAAVGSNAPVSAEPET
jgi:O-antigen ligase